MGPVLGERLSRALLAYYYGPDHPAKLRLWALAMRALGEPSFTRRYGERGRIALDLRDYVQQAVLQFGAYEPEVWAALAAHAEAGEIVWDVGAHVGTFAVRAAGDRRVAAVHCFEPNPHAFPALDYNRRLNGRLPLFGHPLALGDTNGTAALHFGTEGNLGVASFQPRYNERSASVEVRRGDDVIAAGIAPAPTLLKLDVEGAELAVLRGLERTLSAQTTKAIVFETFASEPESHAAVQFLVDKGYRCTPFEYPEPRETINWIAICVTAVR